MALFTTRSDRLTLVVSATFILSISTLRLSALSSQRAPDNDVSSARRSSKSVEVGATSPGFPSSPNDLLTMLRSEREKGLKTILHNLNIYAIKLALTNDQLDLVLSELERISVSDTYQEPRWGKVQRTPENARLVYANRMAAATAIESLKCQKLANDFRALPIRERLRNILEYVEGRTPAHETPQHASDWFRGELWRIGKDAVPFILERAEEAPEFRLMYAGILSRLGDPRGIDFVLGTLTGISENTSSYRCELIRKLRLFRDSRIFHFLVEAMQDSDRILTDSRPRQNVRSPNEPIHLVKRYPIRKCASSVLAEITDAHWTLVFREDPKSWQAWWIADNRQAFDPASIVRTQEELETLLENFTYAAMDEFMRSQGWHGGTRAPFMVSKMRSDLIKLGPQVPPILVSTYRSITEEFPVWEDDLRLWTKMLLTTLDTPESRTAARALPD